MPDDGRTRRHPRRAGAPLTAKQEPLLLGLDLGTSRLKAMLMDHEGREFELAFVPTPFSHGEMTVDQLVGALAQLSAALGDARERVVAVGVAGIAESGAPLDRHGRAQAPIIAWHDPRGADVVERLRHEFGPALERSIGQRLRTVSSVAKLGWLVDHGVGPVDRWLGVPELALHALTGRVATEFSLAARTGGYDVGEHRYLPEVAQTLGVGPDVFPPVEPAGRPMGRVSAAGAAWSGLPEGIPVTIAGHDHLVGRSGCGARPNDLANSVGTAETVVAGVKTLPEQDRALSLRVAVTVMPGGKGWALLASAARAGIVLSAVAQAAGCSAEEMDEQAEGGTRVAVDDLIIETVAHGGAFELPAAPPGAVWNGVLDALVARTWDAADRIGQVAGGVGGQLAAGGVLGSGGLVVFGGGSRSGPWLKAKAAARPGTPVWRSGTTEAVARGAALSAGVAAGSWPAPDAGPQVARQRVVTE